MSKLLKSTGITLAIIILLLISALVLLTTLVSPNHFKPLIIEQVKKNYDRELIIDGDLSWSFFPYLGFKMGHLILNNPPGFKEKVFAEIGNASVSVKLLPLFHGQIESKGIILNGMKLNLIKNAKGQKNWTDLQSKTSNRVNSEIVEESPNKAAFGVAILGMDVNHSKISFQDDIAKQRLELDEFQFHAKGISLVNSFPIVSSFKINAKNPDISGEISLKTEISLNLADQIFELNHLRIVSKINKGQQHVALKLNGNLLTDLSKQTSQLNDLEAEVNNLQLQGNVNITQVLSNPHIVGKIEIKPFDGKKFLSSIGSDIEKIKTLSEVAGDFDFIYDTPKSIALNGRIKINELNAADYKINNLKTDAKIKENIVTLSNIDGDFFQGKIAGDANIHLSTPLKMTLNAKIQKVQVEPLMALLASNKKIKLTGVGNLEFNINTSGLTSESIQKNLNGNAKLNVQDGILKGIDIAYYIDTANDFFTRQATSNTNTEQTSFGSLNATFVIKNGVVSNKDLILNSPRFTTRGNGSINLPNRKIDFHIQALANQKEGTKEKSNLMNLYHLPIPIVLTGDLNNPTIRLDQAVLVQALAVQQTQKVKEKVQAKIEDKIKDKLKDKLPEGAAELISGFFGKA